jgi:uncharacterized metal-binding protein
MSKRCIDCRSVLELGSELCDHCGSEFACFGTAGLGRVSMKTATESEKRRFYENQCALARKSGVSTQVALYAYKVKFGEDPSIDARATVTA